jgi:glycerol kinase
MARAIHAIDQGTTSTRCMLFDRSGRTLASDQKAHRQIYPRPGWVEHDPTEIWQNTQAVIFGAWKRAGMTNRDLAAVGIANQCETIVGWEKASGRPIYPAIVWQDTRTVDLCDRLSVQQGLDRFSAKTGLPLSTYFSGPKLQWRASKGERLCCTKSGAWWSITVCPNWPARPSCGTVAKT